TAWNASAWAVGSSTRRAARIWKPAPSRWARILPVLPARTASGLMMASVSISGRDEAADDVRPREESHDDPFPDDREAVDVLRAHQVRDVAQRLVLRQAQHRARHGVLHRDEPRVRGATLQLGAGRRPKLAALGALQKVGNEVAEQLAMGHHADERAP